MTTAYDTTEKQLKQTHRRHPKQSDPFSRMSAADKEQYRLEFIAMEQHLQRMCMESRNGPPILERVDPMDYYRDMFPEGSFETCTWEQQLNDAGEPVMVARPGLERRPNGMISILNDKEERGRSYTRLVFDDLEEIKANMDKEKALISPIGFCGRKRRSSLAYCFFGMVFDLDNVGLDELDNLLYQMQNGALPMATYLVHTTSGFHVVYLFDDPIPALPQYFDSLNHLKADISDQLWTKYTSRDKNKQFQGIFQGFRMAGTPTKLGPDYRSTVFRLGKKTTIHALNEYALEENKCIFDDIKHISLAEAKEMWADWYQRRIVEGRAVGEYALSERERIRRRAWYDTWKQRIRRGAKEGYRHYCVGVLFHYAMKAEIPLEEVLNDALDMVYILDMRTEKPENEFTADDVYAAMIYYERRFIRLGRKGIQRLTNIDIGETKRNGRPQKVHMSIASAIRDVIYPDGEWRNKDGRPVGSGTKQAIVQEWRQTHPNGKKADCIRETGLSKPTVLKWWDSKEG